MQGPYILFPLPKNYPIDTYSEEELEKSKVRMQIAGARLAKKHEQTFLKEFKKRFSKGK